MDDSEDSWFEAEDPIGTEAEVNEFERFRQDFLERIERIEAAGSFATSGTFDAYPNPGILVDGELIALPLLEDGARKLASRSHKAEKNKQTLEIGANRINFQNPGWLEFVNKLVKRVACELGVPSADSESHIRAELHKSLLYEPGAIFKAHKE
jgi:hypothetical protein